MILNEKNPASALWGGMCWNNVFGCIYGLGEPDVIITGINPLSASRLTFSNLGFSYFIVN